MKRILSRKSLLTLPVGLLAAVLLSAGSASAVTSLSGSVGPGFTISLKKGGKKVKSLKAGRYRISVNDKSDFHNFHISGPGVNRRITTVDFQGKKSRTFKFKKGTYRYVCDPHADSMKGSFKVR
jgi:Copper binding proteins, plastocyanin/azurin family